MQPALVVANVAANDIIEYLKRSKQINLKFRIQQIEDKVYIPIQNLDLKVPKKFEYSIRMHDFEERKKKPSSLKEALIQMNLDLPQNDIQTSYDQIGTIAIIDLKENLIPFASSFGEAILSSNPSIKTVYRKSSKVKGLTRIRDLELIGGVKNTLTVHKEYGISILVDVSQVYFSPRLAEEHHRVASKIQEHTSVLDMFGALAPFGLHIAKSKIVKIVSLDINPHVPELIKKTISMNHLKGIIEVVCEDAMEFTKTVGEEYDYVIMNHPSNAFNFLSNAIKVTKIGGIIFYYDFIPILDYEETTGVKLHRSEIEIQDIHIVRQSSPTEYHLCVTLKKISSQLAHHSS